MVFKIGDIGYTEAMSEMIITELQSQFSVETRNPSLSSSEA